MTGAEITVVGALLGERYATEMRADRYQHLPLIVSRLDARRIRLRIGQLGHVHVLRLFDLFLRPVRDEDRLAAPEYLDRLSLRNGSEVDLDGCTGRDGRGIRVHLRNQGPEYAGGADRRHGARRDV